MLWSLDMADSKLLHPGRGPATRGVASEPPAQYGTVGKQTLVERAYGGGTGEAPGAVGKQTLTARAQGSPDGTISPALAQARAELERLIHRDPHDSTDAATEHILTLLRKAGVHQPGLIAAQNVLRSYWNLFWQRQRGGPTFEQDLAVYHRQLEIAAQTGVISLHGAIEAGARASAWKRAYAPKTPGQVTAANVARNAAATDVFAHANAVLEEAQELRRWVDKEHGWINVGWGFYSVVQRCIGEVTDTAGVVGGAARTLQDRLALPETDANKRDLVQAAAKIVEGYLAQLRHKGGSAAADLAELREQGFELLDRASSAAGFIPAIGKPLSVALTATGAGLRYASGDWSASEAVVKTLVAAVGARFGEAIAGEGSLAARALRTFVHKALAGLAGDLTGILTNRELDATQRVDAIKAAISKCLGEAFIEAIEQITSGAIKINAAEEGREAYLLLHEAAVKLGINQALAGPLESLKNAWKER